MTTTRSLAAVRGQWWKNRQSTLQSHAVETGTRTDGRRGQARWPVCSRVRPRGLLPSSFRGELPQAQHAPWWISASAGGLPGQGTSLSGHRVRNKLARPTSSSGQGHGCYLLLWICLLRPGKVLARQPLSPVCSPPSQARGPHSAGRKRRLLPPRTWTLQEEHRFPSTAQSALCPLVQLTPGRCLHSATHAQ